MLGVPLPPLPGPCPRARPRGGNTSPGGSSASARTRCRSRTSRDDATGRRPRRRPRSGHPRSRRGLLLLLLLLLRSHRVRSCPTATRVSSPPRVMVGYRDAPARRRSPGLERVVVVILPRRARDVSEGAAPGRLLSLDLSWVFFPRLSRKSGRRAACRQLYLSAADLSPPRRARTRTRGVLSLARALGRAPRTREMSPTCANPACGTNGARVPRALTSRALARVARPRSRRVVAPARVFRALSASRAREPKHSPGTAAAAARARARSLARARALPRPPSLPPSPAHALAPRSLLARSEPDVEEGAHAAGRDRARDLVQRLRDPVRVWRARARRRRAAARRELRAPFSVPFSPSPTRRPREPPSAARATFTSALVSHLTRPPPPPPRARASIHPRRYKRGWFCAHCEHVYRKPDDDPVDAPAWIGCDHCDGWAHYDCELRHAPEAVLPPPAAAAARDGRRRGGRGGYSAGRRGRRRERRRGGGSGGGARNRNRLRRGALRCVLYTGPHTTALAMVDADP